MAPILGEDIHDLPEVQPPPKKPMIAVTYTRNGMKPYMEPGTRYMAIQEELEFIADGELVVAEIMHEVSDGKRADQVFVGIVSRRGDLVSIDRPKAEPIVARVAAIHWIARIARPVSEVVVDGP